MDSIHLSSCWALASLATLNGVPCQPDLVASRLVSSKPDLIGFELARVGMSLGLRCAVRRGYRKRIEHVPTPCIIRSQDGSFGILASIVDEMALVQTYGNPPHTLTIVELTSLISDEVIVVTRRALDLSKDAKFGLRWFVTQVWRYRRQMRDILLASLFVQLLGLVTPILFQAITDKVLVHQTVDTLYVIAAALTVVAIFEVCLDLIRQYLLGHTASRIDADLGARLYAHLVELPLSFFSSRQTGQTIQRMRELDRINEFFTGQALTAVLDLLFVVLYLIVMLFYSVQLTIIVALSLPLYAAIALGVLPVLRRRLDDLFMRHARTQSFLVESVSGMETVKSGALGTVMRRDWEVLLAGQVKCSFGVVQISAWAGGAVQLLTKVVYILVLVLGAKSVISGSMTVGGLIAFTMFTSHISAPILRLASLWNGFQQVRVSIERIGEILNSPKELTAASATRLPELRGAVSFEDVVFRYSPDLPDVLRGLHLSIAAGEVIGIVGRSGSGKSTIAKLIMRLYVPTRGRVCFDGVDAQVLDPTWLRGRIGVVGQEGFLFNRSVRDNIAIANPALGMDAVISACQLAGAHEFISALPAGYDTLLEERGMNLSGGQRQRLAIARAIINDPTILVFDEATSALDPETEEIIRTNLRAICAKRTAIIISHRLSAITDCDRILMVDGGVITESGTHSELMARKDSYFRLFSGQRS